MSQLPSVALSRHSHEAPALSDAYITYACRLAPNTLLCCGHLPYTLTGKEKISIDGLEAQKPYLAGRLVQSDVPLTAIILRVDERHLLETAGEVSFISSSSAHYWYNKGQVDETGEHFGTLADSLPPKDLAKLYYLLLKYYGLQPSSSAEQHVLRLALACVQRLEPHATGWRNLFWLSSDTVYLEAPVAPESAEDFRAIFASASGFYPAKVSRGPTLFHDQAEDGPPFVPLLIQFASHSIKKAGAGVLSLLFSDRLLVLKNTDANANANLAGFLQRLHHLTEQQRLALRDFTVRSLIENASADAQANAAALVRNLQLYITQTHSTLYNKHQPFGLNIEAAYTIGREGVFLSGWMHDPLHLLEEMTLMSDLGFSLPLRKALTFFRREDVLTLYGDDSAFAVSDARQGFIAYLEFSEEHRTKYLAWPEGFSYRVAAHLKGGLSFTVAPEAVHADPFTLRSHLMGEKMQAWLGHSDTAIDVLGRAARTIQDICVQQMEVRDVYTLGIAPNKPRVSVVIPLYENLEYVQAQIAHFAGDPAMKNAEVIYVLDSPHQEEKLYRLLQTCHALYRFPIKLMVLARNGGYAVATNMGAKEAKAQRLLLMNSDVLPYANGWLDGLCAAFDAAETPGALAPMLLYEDGGIQHAGMYFSLEELGGCYENLHYFKGYPASHPSAAQSRVVPAVSGACMLVDRAAFEKAGRLTTDYVIGDFEDSDLCLKLSTLGLIHYYCADASLYHFERQSFNASPSHSSLRYRINAREHHSRWRSVIRETMEKYHG